MATILQYNYCLPKDDVVVVDLPYPPSTTMHWHKPNEPFWKKKMTTMTMMTIHDNDRA